jgi:1-acyl-sn-glycerol-3-phosphate acyltransferase
VTATTTRIPVSVRAWYRGVASLVIPTMALLTRRQYAGFEHIPRAGGCIIAANHITELDPIVVAYALYMHGFHSSFLAKDKLFKPFGMRHVMAGLGHIPVARGGGGQPAMDAARRVLDYGGVIVIYPEGTLTRDPDLWPMVGRSGAVRLALETGVPLLPAAQWGAQHILPQYARRPTLFPRRTIQMSVGAPMDLSAYAGRVHDRAALGAGTDAVMDAITALLLPLRGGTPPLRRFDPGVSRDSRPSGPAQALHGDAGTP